MTDIYYIKLEYDQLDSWISFFERNVSAERIAQSQKYKYKEDKLRNLLGEVLVVYAMSKSFGMKINVPFKRNCYGKPYINQEVHFNLSHSGEFVICAVDNSPVGIDIERIAPINFTQFSNFFSSDELIKIKGLKDESKALMMFYSLWVLKESYIKYTGEGFMFSPEKCSFELETNMIVYKNLYRQEEEIRFDFLQISEQYKGALCHQKNTKINQICELQFSSFI